MSNTLFLVLTKKWFDMIQSGIKLEEYRATSEYWRKRLLCKIGDTCQFWGEGGRLKVPPEYFRQFDTVTFQHGYQKNAPRVVVEFKGIEIGIGKSEWGATGESFIIKLGKIINP